MAIILILIRRLGNLRFGSTGIALVNDYRWLLNTIIERYIAKIDHIVG